MRHIATQDEWPETKNEAINMLCSACRYLRSFDETTSLDARSVLISACFRVKNEVAA